MTKPLGNITKFASAQDENERRAWRDSAVSRRYKLLDRARELLPDFKVEACLHVPVPKKTVEIWKDTESGNAHIQGVGRCGSVWVCPVCSQKISIGRRDEVKKAIDLAKDKDLKVAFITYTMRHDRDDRLTDLIQGNRAARRSLKSGGWWQRNVKAHGFVGSISAFELTWGFSAGWHVHNHEIMFFECDIDTDGLENALFERWSYLLDNHDLDCDREHGVKVEPGFDAVAQYVTKWGLQNELTSKEKPGREGHFSPFQLLGLYDDGEDWAGGLFQEHADGTKGLSSLRWSRGLRDLLGVGELATDEELAEAEVSEESIRIAQLTWGDYKKLLYSGRPGVLGELLTVAERGPDALMLWLWAYFKIKPRDDQEAPGTAKGIR